MRMVTRCPACGTAFRVHADQLAARDGHVRCGQCSTVFDAQASLMNEAEPAAAPPAPPPVPSLRSDELAQVEAAVSQPLANTLPPQPEISLADDEPFEFGPGERSSLRRATVLWGLAIVVLAAVLAGQVGYAYRGEIAALWPESRPLLDIVDLDQHAPVFRAQDILLNALEQRLPVFPTELHLFRLLHRDFSPACAPLSLGARTCVRSLLYSRYRRES